MEKAINILSRKVIFSSSFVSVFLFLSLLRPLGRAEVPEIRGVSLMTLLPRNSLWRHFCLQHESTAMGGETFLTSAVEDMSLLFGLQLKNPWRWGGKGALSEELDHWSMYVTNVPVHSVCSFLSIVHLCFNVNTFYCRSSSEKQKKMLFLYMALKSLGQWCFIFIIVNLLEQKEVCAGLTSATVDHNKSIPN